MNVAQLIEILQKMPQDMLMVIPGYEGGYDNIELQSASLILDANWNGKDKNHWYNGRHDYYYQMESNENIQPIACIVVGRGI